jgi:putative hydrolase of the HAD superfamily
VVAAPVAVVFDLDDTLFDWSTGIDRALARVTTPQVAARVRAAIAEHAWLRRDGAVVSRRHWMTRRDPGFFFASALGDGADPGEIARLSAAYVQALELPLFPDALPVLDALAGRVRLGMLSNAPQAVERAARAGIAGRFEVAMSAPLDRKKPHPDAFDAVLAALDLTPADVAFVGDDPEEDVEGALAHGMRAVWIDRIGSGWSPPAGVVHLRTLTDLPAALGMGVE